MTTFDELPPERKVQIDRAADAIDRLMDKLDEIAAPDLYRELQDVRAANRSLLAQLDEARAEIARLTQSLADANSALTDRFFDTAWEDGKLKCAKCGRHVQRVHAHRGQAWCEDCVNGEQA